MQIATDPASVELTSPELATLREHGIVIFADRVIFDAQPPMKASDIAAVQALCAGPIPPQLLDLWRMTAGGSLDYSLTVDMRGNRESVSWNELFFNGSDDYHDLQGWIDHELELAEEAAEEHGFPWKGKLDALPFGGFEYLDRVYAVIQPDESSGRILAWKHGLPPAWTHRLHEDSSAEIGRDLRAAFAALNLPEDPLAPTQEYFAGETLLEYLGVRVEEHGLAQGLADRLIAFYRRAILDWRSKLSNGTLAAYPELALTALEHAIRSDDAALVEQLAVAQVPLNVPVGGSALPLEMALALSAHHASQALIGAGAQVTRRCLDDIHNAAPASLLQLLLARGAEPAVSAVIACAEYGAIESADTVARACARNHPDFRRVFADARRERLKKLNDDLGQVRSGKVFHFLSQEQLKQHIESLMSYSAPEDASWSARVERI